jgi:transcription initiation factor TFIIIB Brf1 subunit/transcription initiation factor TFIIB
MAQPQQQQYCPECGGVLFYDSPARRYACKSCGLYVTREEISDIRARIRNEQDELKRKRREQSEYLEWWLSAKK